MYKLTERRFAKAKPILNRYRMQLHETGFASARGLEKELRDCWNIGYQELKDIIIALSKRPYYRYLAACYMEMGYPDVVIEFQPVLADMYGSKRGDFWKGLKAKTTDQLG
jgi:hypothetical protein